MKVIKIDVMVAATVGEHYYTTVRYPWNNLFRLRLDDLQAWILERLPSLQAKMKRGCVRLVIEGLTLNDIESHSTYDAWKVSPPCYHDKECHGDCPYYMECYPEEYDDDDLLGWTQQLEQAGRRPTA